MNNQKIPPASEGIDVVFGRGEVFILLWVQMHRLTSNFNIAEAMDFLLDEGSPDFKQRCQAFLTNFGGRINKFYYETDYKFPLWLPMFFAHNCALRFSPLMRYEVEERLCQIRLIAAEKAGHECIILGTPNVDDEADGLYVTIAASRKLLPATAHLPLMSHIEVMNEVIDMAKSNWDQVCPSAEDGSLYVELFRRLMNIDVDLHIGKTDKTRESKRARFEHKYSEPIGEGFDREQYEELRIRYMLWLDQQRTTEPNDTSDLLLPVAAQWHGAKIYKATRHHDHEAVFGAVTWQESTPAAGFNDDDVNSIYLISHSTCHYYGAVKGLQ